jgi:NADH dehydrogenase
MWLLVHIYFLSGFKNRLFVLMQWAWSYLTFARGSRLIVSGEWRSYPDPPDEPALSSANRASSTPRPAASEPPPSGVAVPRAHDAVAPAPHATGEVVAIS